MSEVIKDVECKNCDAKFSLTYDSEEFLEKPEYCPFCGDLFNGVDFDEDDFDNDLDELWDDHINEWS